MKNWRMRTRLAAAVAFMLLSGAWTAADDIVSPTMDVTTVPSVDVNLINKDTTRCTKLQNYCSTSCEDSTYIHGVCREGGKNGPSYAISVECCCCTGDAQHRYFIGG